jgi:hypothetical protein
MKPTLPSMSEAELLQCVRDLCRLLKVPVYHTYNSRRSESGWPDIAAVVNDHLILRELKTARGRITPEQAYWLEALSQVKRVSAGIWRPDDWISLRIEAELCHANRDH